MLGIGNGRANGFRLYAQHALVIVVVLLIAACSGGGCSSGCSSCGMTSLARAIPTADTIDNAGSLRVTRSGLDFIAASAPTLAGGFLPLGTGGEYQYPVQLPPTSLDGIQVTFCSGTTPTTTATPTVPEQCELDVGLGRAVFHVDAVTPDAVTVSGTIPIQLEDLPLSGSYSGTLTFGQTVTIHMALGAGTGGCGYGSPANDAIPNETWANVPFTVTLPLVGDTIAPRVGFTKIDSSNVAVNVGITSSDVVTCFNCDFSVLGLDVNLDSTCNSLGNDVVDFALDALQSQVQGEIKSLVQGELCTKPDTTGACPVGSALDTSTGNCDYTAQPGTCLPIGLGVEGSLDLGSLLQSISYGTSSNVDLALGAGGTMIPANAPAAPTGSPADNVGYTGHTPNGITLGLIGALIPDPISACVPQAANPVPTGIPIPVELQENTVTPWAATDPPGPQVGVALAGRYLNYALGSVYNSGALCLGISTDTFSELDSGILSLLAPSIKDLTFEQKTAAAAVITRPQTPPSIAIGGGTNPTTDPLLTISLNQFALDFYIWSDDRFVRAFTYTADLTIPLDLSTAVSSANPNGELLPVLGTVGAMNGTVTNNELLTDDPTTIASGLSGLVGTIVGQVAGSIKPISLASLTSSLGIALTIPPDGIRKLTSGSDDFIALFGDLALAPTGPAKLEPRATLQSTEIHPEAMALTSYDLSKLPTLNVTFGTATPSANPVEYSYWIDQGTRSPWSTDTAVAIQNQALFLQAKHTLFVSAREVGAPMSESTSPATIPFLIDVLPPTMTLTTTDTGATLTAWDYVSDTADLVARTRVTDSAGVEQPWSEWQPLSALATITTPEGGSSLAAEVRDQSGNVASSEVAQIRGRNDGPVVAGACGCSTPGANTALGSRGTLLVLFTALGLVVLARRARRSRARAASTPLDPRRRPVRSHARRPARSRSVRAAALALGVGVVMGSLSQGCSCGGNGTTSVDGGVLPDTGGTMKTDAGQHDSSMPSSDTGTAMTGCGAGCNQPCEPALPQGIIGAYTSIAKDSTGTIWVAGYDDSAITQAFMGLYGDLVVGKYDATKNQVDWTTVDGLPPAMTGICPMYDPTGWRQGQSDPGPDVGLWTSLGLDASDDPIVSYYDATNAALKFASSSNGTTWNAYTVMQAPNSDIGRYSKMLVVNGVPVIAFLIMEPGVNGKLRSRVELATGKVATPASATDWTFEDAAIDDDGPCRTAFCASPSICIQETGECAPPSAACGTGSADAGDAGGGCSSTQVCVGGFDAGPSCGTPLASTFIDIYPNAFGDYIAMAPTASTSNGVGIVVYDRIHGSLVQLAKVGGAWQETVLDSETGARAPNSPDGGITPAETGDVGVGASLFITSTGDWHVSYVNGTTEALQYILVPAGTQQPGAPEVVDNGTMLAGAPYSDGQHIVGDDSSIQVDSMGNVTISYQDSSAGTLHVATGTLETGGTTHAWAVVAASQPNEFAGFFSHSIAGDVTQFANFWRTKDTTTSDESGNVSFVMP